MDSMKHLLCFGSPRESVVADVRFRCVFFYHLFQFGHPVTVPHPPCTVQVVSRHSPSAYPLISEASPSTVPVSHLQFSLDSRIKVQMTADGLSAGGLTSDLISCLFLVVSLNYLEGVTENPQSTVAFNRQKRIQKTNFDAKNEFRFFFMLFLNKLSIFCLCLSFYLGISFPFW